jgi:uncharacterized protein (DUF983 family)
MKTPNKLVAMLTNRCPACHQGKLFIESNPYSKRFMAMEPACSVCGENFKREPGFYFGAAYVSYGLTVALWVSLIVALYVFDAIGLMEYAFFEDGLLTIILGIGLLIVLLPVLFRLSRSLWIHMFVQRKD